MGKWALSVLYVIEIRACRKTVERNSTLTAKNVFRNINHHIAVLPG